MQYILPKSLGRLIWFFLKPYKIPVMIFIILATLTGFSTPFTNLLIKHIVDTLPNISPENTTLLIWPAVWIVSNMLIFDNLTWRSMDYLNYRYQATIKTSIIQKMLDFILEHSYEFFQENLSGRISHLITTLADNIEYLIHTLSIDFIRGVSLLLLSFFTAYRVNNVFFYTWLTWFLIFSTFSFFMSKRFVQLSVNYANSESIVSGQLVDCLANNSSIRIFAKKAFEIDRMQQFFSQVKTAFQTKERFLIVLYGLQGIMIAVMIGFSLYFLVHLYAQKQVSIGDFSLIIGLSVEMGYVVWYTMLRVDEFNQALGKCQQSLKALLIPIEIMDRPDAKELSVEKGHITFEKVKFHYKKNTTPLFENKSIEIPAGQKVGLVGYSGSGKSTFVSLILRLYELNEGRILIDGQDIYDVTQNSLRANIAIIPQDPSLFHRSLMDNIRYGKTDAPDTAVIDAAKKAHAHEFISHLPQGYETLAGERGVKLSGGQRQRIAIARAILKNAPILILDEATSQLDSVTEVLIQDSLWELMCGKTALVIAHRLSTLLKMDRIIVFDQGKIVEDGSHSDLITRSGLYKTLWDAQVGGLLPEHKNAGILLKDIE